MPQTTPQNFDPIAYINAPHWQASRLGLDRIRELLARLGDPQNSLRIVHVAGTNGKGSTCAYIANVLQAAGYRVGWFSSPFIERFEERIRVDGKNIAMPDLARVTLQVREHAEQMSVETGDHPTEFELMTAVALLHFAQVECQVAVLEVGLGGRLDSTNVIAAPDVAVITRIGLDHTDLLGDTIGKIAAEKAGIIKSGSSVVSWPQEPEAAEAVETVAHAAGCTVAQPDFREHRARSPSRFRANRTRQTFDYPSLHLQGQSLRNHVAGQLSAAKRRIGLGNRFCVAAPRLGHPAICHRTRCCCHALGRSVRGAAARAGQTYRGH